MMREIAYIIDKEQSLKNSALTIRIVYAERDGYYLNLNDTRQELYIKEIEKILTVQDKLALQFLISEEIKFQKKTANKILKEERILLNSLKVSSNQSIQALKLMAATGKLHFNGKVLAADFYGKTDFNYFVETEDNGEIKVSGLLKWKGGECTLTECDFIAAGPPHFFIKGILLKMIGTSVTWKELSRLKTVSHKYTAGDIKDLQDAKDQDSEEPALYFAKNSKLIIKEVQEPHPFLILKDKTGAFADLWMDYGNEKKYPYHELNRKRTDTEKGYESDMLETDFLVKLMAKSHYYCPLDKVSKSLTFLMEIGWKIFDFQGRQLVRHTDYNLQLAEVSDVIEVKGTLNYESHQVNISQVLGAFNRRDRFVEISENFIGFIPDSFDNKTLDALSEISEVVTDRVSFKRNKIGAIDELLEDRSIYLDEQLKFLRDNLKNFEGISLVLPKENFKGVLRPYQQEGVNFLKFLYDFQFSGLLADDMGLGKTVQVLAFLSLLTLNKPILIVLPASLVFNWQLEIKRFTPDFKVSIHHGLNREKVLQTDANIILTTYSTLRIDLDIFKEVEFECLILDEAQTIKNAHTQIAIALFSLKSRFRLSITGTPIENHLKELWSHFRFLMPELLGDESSFLGDLQAASSDQRYLKKIKKKIRPFILRRKKEDVAKDLPERIEQTVFVEMPQAQRKIYEDYFSGVKHSLIKKVDLDGFSKHRMEVLEAILRLRQICCHPILVSGQQEESCCSAKMEALLVDIETAILEGRKILVYSQFTSMLKLIAKEVTKKGYSYAYLDGQTVNREKVVSSFQDDLSIPLFLISLKAGGVGLNLTAADYVFLYDPWWNDAIENQAINRAHRIGRKNTVFAKRYIMLETIEEKMMTLKKNKGKIASDIFDDELSEINLSADDFKFLLS